MNEIIDKYFKDDKVKYYNTADLIQDGHYIRYEYNGSRVIISVGSNEGEIPFKVCRTAEKLEETIKFIIYQ